MFIVCAWALPPLSICTPVPLPRTKQNHPPQMKASIAIKLSSEMHNMVGNHVVSCHFRNGSLHGQF